MTVRPNMSPANYFVDWQSKVDYQRLDFLIITGLPAPNTLLLASQHQIIRALFASGRMISGQLMFLLMITTKFSKLSTGNLPMPRQRSSYWTRPGGYYLTYPRCGMVASRIGHASTKNG